jgi:hypothetical protein
MRLHRRAAEEGFATPISHITRQRIQKHSSGKLTGPMIVACQWNYSDLLAVRSDMLSRSSGREPCGSHDAFDSHVLINVGEG